VDSNQDPLLTSANQLFTRFTLGSCVELFVDVDDRGRGVLMSRERDRSLKTIEELSTGTCEQLFLALRIAAIERYVTSVGAVPVIFDDVFIESDEPRSERIFEALGELAGKTQVIVLTHHLHMIDVGNRALGEKLVVQRLPDAAPTLARGARRLRRAAASSAQVRTRWSQKLGMRDGTHCDGVSVPSGVTWKMLVRAPAE
jgi:hypothetical protein